MKGIAIILMVVGHAECDSHLRSFIYLFHMPAFFIIAGWFYKSADDWTGLCRFARGRMVRLWFPFVFWCSSFVLLHNVFQAVHIYPACAPDGSSQIEQFLYGRWSWRFVMKTLLQTMFLQSGTYLLAAPLWFLQVLFFASMLYALSDWVLVRLRCSVLFRRVFLMAGTMAVLMATKYLHIGKLILLEVHMGGLVVSSAGVLVALGALLRTVPLPMECISGPAAFGLSIVLTILLASLSCFGTLELCSNEYPSIAFMLVSSLLGFFLLYAVAQICRRWVAWMLAAIGRHTLPILILHLFIFHSIDLCAAHMAGYPLCDVGVYTVAHRGFLWCLLYVVCGVGIPLLLNNVWHRFVGRCDKTVAKV